MRARWTTVGALAVIVVGAVGFVHAEPPAGQANVFVPVSPCRLLDTRPAPHTVGERSTPLRADETIVQQVTGVNGNCTIPLDASGVSTNVTAVGGTAASFLVLWPTDAPERPLASNLNWLAGAPPTPNKVDVGLAADGSISIYNLAGRVDVIVDVVGYYTTHTHDDRYYTRDEIDQQGFLSTVERIQVSGSSGPTTGGATATCPDGTTLIGGGASSRNGLLRMYGSWPEGNGWVGVFQSTGADATGANFLVFALCAS